MPHEMIYIAVPYRHTEPTVQQWRYEQVTALAAKLVCQGKHVFSPITHGHPMHLLEKLPQEWKFWQDYDFWFLSRSTKMIVLQLEGWKDSVGVQAEIKFAKENGIEIEFV